MKFLFLILLLSLSQIAAAKPVTDTLPRRANVQSQVIIDLLVDSLNARQKSGGAYQKIDDARGSLMGLPALQHLNDTTKSQFLNYVGQNFGAARYAEFQKSMNMLKDTGRLDSFLAGKLRGFYALMKPDMASYRMPVGIKNDFKGADVEIAYGDSSHAISGWWNKVSIADQVAIGSIPIAFNYSNLSGYSYESSQLNDRNLMKASFDKKAYLDKLDKQIKEQYDLRKYFLEGVDFKAHMRSFLDKRMEEIRSMVDVSGTNEFLQTISPDQLLNLDSNHIQNVLLEKSGLSTEPGSVSLKKTQLLAALENENIADSSKSLIAKQLAQYEAVDRYSAEILKLKNEVGTGGLDASKLLNSQASAREKLGNWLNDKNNTPELAKQLLPLGIMEKIMLSVKNLDIGNIVANASSGSVADLFMTGVSGSALHNNKFVMGTVGQRNDIGVRHAGLRSSIATPTYNMQFARLGTGDINSAHTHVSALNASTKSANRQNFNMQSLSQNVFAGSVSKRIDLGEHGTLEGELSKSSSSFSNMFSSSVEQSAAPKAAIAGLLDDFWTTLSAGIRYAGEVKEWRVTQGAYFNYSGLGYNNPGNPGSNKGSVQYGFNLKRNFKKNKAAVLVRADMRDIDRSALSGGSRWKNMQFSLDGRYRFGRHLTMNVRLNQGSMNEVSDEKATSVFLNRKLTVSSQMNGKFGEVPQSHVVMVGVQQMDYLTATAPVKSTLINMNMMQSLSLSGGVLSFNSFLSQDLSNSMAYGNMLTSDVGYSYSLGKLLNCSSAATFLDTKDIARQIGARQSIGALLMKKLAVNLFVDLRKNLIRSNNNFLYGNFKTEMTIHYALN